MYPGRTSTIVNDSLWRKESPLVLNEAVDDETDNTDPARFVFGALAANTNPHCFISPEQFQLDNTTVAPLQQLQVRDSQTEIRAELIKLMNDWIAKLITDQEYKNAVGEILGFIN